jgi:hypothetical protein
MGLLFGRELDGVFDRMKETTGEEAASPGHDTTSLPTDGDDTDDD